MEKQIWPTKQPDGTIYERHVYSGPQGDGYTDIYRREKEDGSFEIKRIHVGPEDRPSDDDFIPVDLAEDSKIKLKRIIEEKAEWKPDVGFVVNNEKRGV
jgi:hypothetical protein